MTDCLSILGSTGSIGTQAIEVARMLNIKVCALTADKNVKRMEEQVRLLSPLIAVMNDETAAAELKLSIADTRTKVLSGMDGLIEAATVTPADTVLNSLVGMVGLTPTLAACRAKKNIALANKETLVSGGKLVTDTAAENGVSILPVDSEHSAVFQCLQACPDKGMLKKLILTASGGPFFGRTRSSLCDVTLEQALCHPNWSMGAKITVDSATMMNKGLEIIEAAWLFSLSPDDIEVVVHRQSVIHSLIELRDSSVLAQLGVPDMKIPIQYALTFPDRIPSDVQRLDLTEFGSLTFEKPDDDTFVCMNACRRALALGGTSPAVANGANEAANLLFRQGKLSFLDIGELVSRSVEDIPPTAVGSIQDILDADAAARDYVLRISS